MGNTIIFPQKTVGGTINTIIASARAKGTTIIKNAAREPHVIDVCTFLNACGADIRGAGSDEITIIGQNSFHGAEFTVSPDMIEAGTYLFVGLSCGGKVTCSDAPCEHLNSVLNVLKNMGAKIERKDNNITAYAENLIATDVETSPYPGFPTDLHPQLAVLMSKAKGISTIKESVFKSRFKYLDSLKKLGMECSVIGDTLKIYGERNFSGTKVSATDLRGGAALIIAALSAKGKTVIENTHYISRGYSDTVQKLTSLGAKISFRENL